MSWGTAFRGPGLVRRDMVWRRTTGNMVCVLPSSHVVLCLMPNAPRQALPEAGARHERRLEAVACTRLLGPARIPGDMEERFLTPFLLSRLQA